MLHTPLRQEQNAWGSLCQQCSHWRQGQCVQCEVVPNEDKQKRFPNFDADGTNVKMTRRDASTVMRWPWKAAKKQNSAVETLLCLFCGTSRVTHPMWSEPWPNSTDTKTSIHLTYTRAIRLGVSPASRFRGKRRITWFNYGASFFSGRDPNCPY